MSSSKPKRQLKAISDLVATAKPLRQETFFVEDWGIDVTIRELRADEADIWKKINANMQGGEGFSTDNVVELCSLSICTPEGDRIFTKAEDIEFLKKQAWGILQAIFLRALSLGSMSAKGIEAEKKGSGSTPSSSSSSD